MTRKRVLAVIILFVFFLICTAYLLYMSSHSGQGLYSGKNLDNYITVGQYKGISMEFTSDNTNARKSEVWNKILEGSEIKKYPNSQVKKYYEKNHKYYEDMAEAYGYSDFEAYVEDYYGCSEKEFEENLREYAKSEVANEMLVYSIAREENLEITEEEYEQLLEETLTKEGFTRESFEEAFGQSIEEYAEENNLEVKFLQEKVMEIIMESVISQ